MPFSLSTMSSTAVQCLNLLARGPMIGMTLCHKTGLTPATISRAANSLVELGLATSALAADDARCVVFTITDKGRAVNSRVRALIRMLEPEDTVTS
jgi:DNA-binding MarR family transcriptional regulator